MTDQATHPEYQMDTDASEDFRQDAIEIEEHNRKISQLTDNQRTKLEEFSYAICSVSGCNTTRFDDLEYPHTVEKAFLSCLSRGDVTSKFTCLEHEDEAGGSQSSADEAPNERLRASSTRRHRGSVHAETCADDYDASAEDEGNQGRGSAIRRQRSTGSRSNPLSGRPKSRGK